MLIFAEVLEEISRFWGLLMFCHYSFSFFYKKHKYDTPVLILRFFSNVWVVLKMVFLFFKIQKFVLCSLLLVFPKKAMLLYSLILRIILWGSTILLVGLLPGLDISWIWSSWNVLILAEESNPICNYEDESLRISRTVPTLSCMILKTKKKKIPAKNSSL